ncbi:hypothetical protein BC938DRAFT_474861 [Jimgerdemannia flammicorona]|uniref:ATP-dependent DNA helicase II subunit 2 n=1 Tax=Jimgerdemannia flammicorona TaxID=994334 RepID=A0A433QS51_9FUNG|nr:hypothetical protein BC938DRAFT_474861 [Jimgerdemannia flammicorona]
MAGKAATVYLLDLAPTMGAKRQNENVTNLDNSIKLLTAMIQDKVIIGRKTDMVGVVLSGTNALKPLTYYIRATIETENHLATEPGQYEHITELRAISQPNLALLRELNSSVVVGDDPGDLIDALIVAIDMMVVHCRQLKYQKKLVLFTDAETPVNIDDAEAIQNQLINNNIELAIVGIDFDDPDTGFKQEDKPDVKRENEEFFRSLITNVNGTFITVPEAFSELFSFRTKSVKPTTVYQGDLTLGDPEAHPDTALAIPVHMFARTYELKSLTAKKYSVLAETSPENERKTCEVTMSRTFKIKGMGEAGEGVEEEEVEKEDLEKAYMYGKTIVPIRKVDEEVLKLKTNKELSILGFLNADAVGLPTVLFNSAVFLHNYMRPARPPPHNSHLCNSSPATTPCPTSTSLCHRRTTRVPASPFRPSPVACWRRIISPLPDMYRAPTQDPSSAYYFQRSCLGWTCCTLFRGRAEVYIRVAGEDRHGVGEGADRTQEHPVGGDAQQDRGIHSRHGPHDDVCEYLPPENTFNPAYQRLNEAIKIRALDPSAPIPPSHDQLLAQLRPVPELTESTRGLVQEMKTLFDVKKVQAKTKDTKRGYGAATTAALTGASSVGTVNDILNRGPSEDPAMRVKIEGEDATYPSGMNMRALTENAVRRVGTVNPVADFRSMVANRQEDLVSLAVEQMCDVIKQLVTTSFNDQFYAKAVDCLKALREVCVSENESDIFNAFLPDLRATCLGTSRRADFWDMVVAENVTIISSEESPSSKVTQGEADKFLRNAEIVPVQPERPVDDDAVDTDDLLNMME